MEYLHHILDNGMLGLLFLSSMDALALERFFVYRAIRVKRFTDRRELELHMTHQLHLIATIGLLGTVPGIMRTFSDIGTADINTTRIMTGLAMALKATALGLVVAIPAVTLYNLLLRRCNVLMFLTIVLTTSTFIATGGIEVELPKASATSQPNELHSKTMVIDRNGRIWLNGTMLSLEELSSALTEIDRKTPRLVRADKNLVLQGIADGFAAIRQPGFSQLSLQNELAP
ncbi:MotA/TolQ/ExbB proton channel family protein [Desulfobulbus propionicus]